MNLKGIKWLAVIFVISFLTISQTQMISPFFSAEEESPVFTLKAVTIDGGVGVDYLEILAVQLAEINVALDIENLSLTEFSVTVFSDRDYDICTFGFNMPENDPNSRGIYDDSGTNIFGYEQSMDFDSSETAQV